MSSGIETNERTEPQSPPAPATHGLVRGPIEPVKDVMDITLARGYFAIVMPIE